MEYEDEYVIEYEGYKRNTLDDFTIGELIDEIERRKARINKRAEVDNAVADIKNNIENAEVIDEEDNLVKKVYTIEVRYER